LVAIGIIGSQSLASVHKACIFKVGNSLPKAYNESFPSTCANPRVLASSCILGRRHVSHLFISVKMLALISSDQRQCEILLTSYKSTASFYSPNVSAMLSATLSMSRTNASPYVVSALEVAKLSSSRPKSVASSDGHLLMIALY
jgi:hypothetical protein